MYGSVFRLQPKPGKEQDIIRNVEEWGRERRPKVKGFVANYVYKLDKGGMMGVAVFQSKDDYVANAQDPEQDAWFRKLRDLLEADPEWNDGEIAYSSS